jgi:hypothetical protein
MIPASMDVTVEVRWFGEGSIPVEISEWFRRGSCPPERAAPRIDHYLLCPNTDTLGIKLREGRIEIKQRQYEYGVRHFHKRIFGRVEAWRKWSFELAVGADYASSLLDGSWLGVTKERELQRYQILGSDRVVAISATDHPDRECALELTKIRAKGGIWWSLGFEAFGDGVSLEENLLLVAQHLFSSFEAPSLGAEGSLGYPKWLGLLLRRT